MPSHLLGPLILLWPITEVYRGFVALQALRLSPYLLSDTVSNSLSLQTGGSGNIATINQQRQTGNTSASFPAQPLSMSGGMTGGGGWSTMGGRLGPLPDSVLRLAGTSHLLRAASWELYGRWVVVWSDFFLCQDYWLRFLSDGVTDMNKSESFCLSLLPFYPSWKSDFWVWILKNMDVILLFTVPFSN